jgi:hypothetical protein
MLKLIKIYYFIIVLKYYNILLKGYPKYINLKARLIIVYIKTLGYIIPITDEAFNSVCNNITVTFRENSVNTYKHLQNKAKSVINETKIYEITSNGRIK